jgi:hypothetical protein
MKRIILLLTAVFTLPLFIMAQLTNSGATIVMTPGTQLVLDNISLQNDGTFNQATGIVNFNGNSNTSIGGSIAPRFYMVKLNKLPATLQLQNNIVIGNELQFLNGLLDLNTHTVTLDPTAILANENLTSHAIGALGGYIEITQSLNAPAASNPGNLAAIISSSQNLGLVTIRRGHKSQTNGAGIGNSILRYYDIIPSNNAGLNATLNFSYFDAELNRLNENNLTIWKTNNTTNWTNLGRTSNSAVANYVEQTGINDLARFTLSTPNNALPLTWGHFTTQCISGQTRINWKTEQELNTLSFIIRRSSNARDWTVISSLPAAGNSTAPIDYSYTDQHPLAGAAYYQIQQTDIDGRATLSPVLLNDCGAPDAIKVFPNPVQQVCQVRIQSSQSGPVILKLYDSKGALILEKKDRIQNGSTLLELRMDKITRGIYSLLITLPGGATRSLKIEKI